MEAKVIYRIEHKELGMGCYTCRGRVFNQDRLKRHNNNNNKNRPTPAYDFPEVYGSEFVKHYLSGCKSITQLKKWFGTLFGEILEDDVFAVFEYKVIDYVEGKSGRQVFFRKDNVFEKKVIEV